jgi:hypothetical protein
MRTRTKVLGASLAACLLASSNVVADPAPTPVVIHQTPAGYAQRVDEPRRVTFVSQGPTYDETYTTWNSSLFIGGAVLFGASYGAAVVAASRSDREADDRLYVPLLGPWLDLADRRDCDVEISSCDNETTLKVLIVTDGVLQAAGAFMMLDAILFPTVHRSSTTTAALEHVKPIRVGDGGRGLAVSGKF